MSKVLIRGSPSNTKPTMLVLAGISTWTTIMQLWYILMIQHLCNGFPVLSQLEKMIAQATMP